MVPLILAALAPYVAALQRAAFRAGVEAAATACVGIANGALIARAHGIIAPADADTAERMAGACAEAIRLLPVPAGFAAPGPGALEALRPFAEIGQWLFARDLPDDTPLVEAGGINGYAVKLTRGHFKAAHRALREAEASVAEVPHG